MVGGAGVEGRTASALLGHLAHHGLGGGIRLKGDRRRGSQPTLGQRFAVLAVVVPLATGRIVIGHNVDVGYYDQELSGVSDHNTVMAEMASVDPVATIGELRSFLGAFGFGEDLFDRQVGRLSGGERGRLSLMRLIKEGHNTLLLDEPTAGLDPGARAACPIS